MGKNIKGERATESEGIKNPQLHRFERRNRERIEVDLIIFKGLIVKGIAMKEEIIKMAGDIEISDNRVLEVEL